VRFNALRDTNFQTHIITPMGATPAASTATFPASQHSTTIHMLCTSIKLPRRYHCLQVIYFHSAFIANSTVHKFCTAIQPIQITKLFTGCATNPGLITWIQFTSLLIITWTIILILSSYNIYAQISKVFFLFQTLQQPY